ncbi:AbiTii domain-containing protein [Acetobacter senegalensis]|uniref:AbiTii domain-containing protein n=1 Tax=Acetobacter senegalensis TaxID=446692 RepID=UPI00264B5135|nr:hypothetical protein [Acetobacter senegalensis]MDN7351552.1 hypothetical protein [Acetobacter senegalensis]
MSLIKIIQRQILDDTCRVSTLLLSAKLIAKKLNQKEILSWLESEINGYSSDDIENDKLPAYRFLSYRPQFYNDFHGWCPIVWDGRLAYPVTDSLTKLQRTIDQDGGIVIHMGGPIREEISKQIGFETQVRFLLERSDLGAIIDSVRDNILEWSIALEAKGITGDGVDFPQDQIEKASQMVVTIHNSGNMNGLGFGDGNSISAHQNDVSTSSVDNSKIRDLISQIKPIIDHVGLPSDALKDANTNR